MVHALAAAVLAPNFVFHCIHRSRLGKVQNQRLGKVNRQKGQRMAAGNGIWQASAKKGQGLGKGSCLGKGRAKPIFPGHQVAAFVGATMIRELASLAMEDGASHPELIKSAESGNWGAQPGNIPKQVMKKFRAIVKLAEPSHISVKCIDAKTSLEKLDQAAVMLPHLHFAALAEHYPMFCQEAFSLGKGSLEKFWEGVWKVGGGRLEGNPMCLEKHWKQKSIP